MTTEHGRRLAADTRVSTSAGARELSTDPGRRPGSRAGAIARPADPRVAAWPSGTRRPARAGVSRASPWPRWAAWPGATAARSATSTWCCCTTARSLGAEELARAGRPALVPDLGRRVRLDHSVRTVDQCRTRRRRRPRAAVGLLDLTLRRRRRRRRGGRARPSSAHDWRANARTPAAAAASRARASATPGTATSPTSLEPDLKEARGGLRDMTVLRALAAAWLADRPHGAVDEAAPRRCSTSATRCTSSPAGAATGSAARTTTPWPRCSATTTPTTC